MGFLAGISFIAKVSKHILTEYHVFEYYDKQLSEFKEKKQKIL